SNNRKKFPIWIPIVSLILAIILNLNAVQMLSRGMISSGMTDIFGAFLLYCFIRLLAKPKNKENRSW
ncbi:hypothetical protein, partial [Moraxella caprae]